MNNTFVYSSETIFNEEIRGRHVTRMKVCKELEVIAHIIAGRGRGFPYCRCQLPTLTSSRVKGPLGGTIIINNLNNFAQLPLTLTSGRESLTQYCLTGTFLPAMPKF